MRSGIVSEMLSLTLRRSSSACDLRSSGANPMPALIASAGLLSGIVRAVDSDRRRRACDRGRRSPRPVPNAPRPSIPRGPRLRPACTSKLTSLTRFVVRPRTERTAFPLRRPPLSKRSADRPADHRLHDFRLRELGGRPRLDQTAVAQHRDAVRQIAHLPHAMRDIDHADAVVSSRRTTRNNRWASSSVSDEVGSSRASTRRPRRSARMISRVAAGRREVPRRHPGAKLFLQSEFAPACATVRLREIVSIEEDSARSPEVAEKQVLGDGHVRNDVRLLVDHANPERVRVARATASPPNAPGEQFALVGRKDALEYPDEGRFSGAVFPDQGEHLARMNRERHVVERLNDAEALRYADAPPARERPPALRLASARLSRRSESPARRPRQASICGKACPCRTRNCPARQDRP